MVAAQACQPSEATAVIDPLSSAPSAATLLDSPSTSAAAAAASVDINAAESSTQSPITNAEGANLGDIREYLEQAVAEALESYEGEGYPRDAVQQAVESTLQAHGFDFAKVAEARADRAAAGAVTYSPNGQERPADPEDPATAVNGFLSQLPPGSLAGNVA